MIEIDGQALPMAQIIAVARSGAKVQFTAEALNRMKTARSAAEHVVKCRGVYGRTTGVGANRSTALSQDGDHAQRLLRSHSIDAGEQLPNEAVRAMLIIRASQLAAGGSGVHPSIAQRVLDMLNSSALPVVRQYGGIGTGDLHALAATALTIMGERTATDGSLMTATDSWTVHDALPFISSNALTLGRSVLALTDLDTLVDNGLMVAALSFLALRGNGEAYDFRVAETVGSAGAIQVAQSLRGLVRGAPPPARIQDPYCLRTIPQQWGPILDEIAGLTRLLTHQVVSAQENPLIFSGPEPDVAHHGTFLAANLALRLDALRLSLAAGTSLNLRRISLLADPSYTGLNRFLAVGPEGSSGIMMTEYVAASALGSLRANANPVSAQTTVISLGAEEDATFAPAAIEQFEYQINALGTILSVEYLCATRALQQQESTASHGQLSPGVRAGIDAVAGLPRDHRDRDLGEDLQTYERIVRSNLRGTMDLVP